MPPFRNNVRLGGTALAGAVPSPALGCRRGRWLSARGTGDRHEAVAVTPPHSFPPMTPIAGSQEVRSQLGRFKGGQEPADTQQSRARLRSHPAGDP